jgi:hypothetical protein
VPKLLHDSLRAEVALEQLVASLRSLGRLPTSMRVHPSSVLRSLFEETGWPDQLAEDPQRAELELQEIRSLVAAWERRLPVGEPGPLQRRGRRAARRRRRAFAAMAASHGNGSGR